MDSRSVTTIALLTLQASAWAGADDVIFIDNFESPTVVPVAYGLNDTGQTVCANATTNGLDCASITDFPGQDAQFGRDASLPDGTNGAAGFSFTKLDSQGVPMNDQAADYSLTPWTCVRDEVTGLVWEVKTRDGGEHDQSWRYSWYSSFVAGTGGPGEANRGQCLDAASCDTEKLASASGANRLCGFDDWRLPTRHELLSLVHYGATGSVLIDQNYFPNTAPFLYWTATLMPLSSNPRTVDFATGASIGTDPVQALAVRLVRGAN